MDRVRFDALARTLAARGSRRAALIALLGAALPSPAAGRRGKRTGRRQRRACYPGTDCVPGPGAATRRCDFGGAALAGRDLRGAVLRGSNLAGADLSGADLSGAALDGACLAGAILLGADLSGAALDGAVFCSTIMPDASILDSGCGRGSACCPTTPDGGAGGGGGGGDGACVGETRQCGWYTRCCEPLVCRATYGLGARCAKPSG